MKPAAIRTRKDASSSGARRADVIPAGYVSAEEFNRVFEQKIRDTQRVQATPKERLRTCNKQLNIIFFVKGNMAVADKISASNMIIN